MTITTVGAARHISPVVIATFVKHYVRQAKKASKDRHLEATDELLFDEAFNIVKRFISLGTNDTIEALQAFTNTRIPAQPWATVVHTLVPLASCELAAQKLIEYFGPDDIKNVVGGEKWWQVRGLNGVEAEWVAMTNDWKKAKLAEELPDGEARARAAKYAKFNRRHERHRVHKAKRTAKTTGKWARNSATSKPTIADDLQASTTEASGSGSGQNARDATEDDEEFMDQEDETENSGTAEDNVPIEELDRLRRTLLYIPGGAYCMGSPNTHRYQVVRLARKMGGRAFVPNYRKAPGYPWPCPLQDCLAAWFYLTQPPPGAKHKAILPKDIILAGDSAGGGMCLALLGVLRDLELPMPAGAVLISPWCDMTHSFPSVLQNTATDIIPPYGFVFKPSTLWPVPAQVSTNEQSPQRSVPQESEAKSSVNASREPKKESHPDIPPAPTPLQSEIIEVSLSEKPNDPIHLKEQIQLYATNDQLYHPLCSPVLQGSLGGLPPLYIIAGDGEVLRDEIIMLAHRAARPEKYKLPEHLLAKNSRARMTAEKYNSQPTKVHLQVFDYQCHVLTMFSFTTAARYAYRAVASFCKYVTNAKTETVNPFPDLREEASATSSVFSGTMTDEAKKVNPGSGTTEEAKKTNGGSMGPLTDEPQSLNTHEGDGVQQGSSGGAGAGAKDIVPDSNAGSASQQQAQSGAASGEVAQQNQSLSLQREPEANRNSKTSSLLGGSWMSIKSTRSRASNSEQPATGSASPKSLAVTSPRKGSKASETNRAGDMTTSFTGHPGGPENLDEKRRRVTLGIENGYSGQVPLIRPAYQEYMIRERVDVRGAVRPMESETEMQAMKMYSEHPETVGIIKEGPTQRYLEGRSIWDERYKRTAKKVEKKRQENESRAEEMLHRAIEQGLLKRKTTGQIVPRVGDTNAPVEWVENEHGYSPIDVALAKETPPPAALAGRRDCDEALTLLRTTLHLNSSSSSSSGVSLFKSRHQDRVDDMVGVPPSQPISEGAQRQKPRKKMHGLNLWVKSMGMFGRKTRKEPFFVDTSTRTAEQTEESATGTGTPSSSGDGEHSRGEHTDSGGQQQVPTPAAMTESFR